MEKLKVYIETTVVSYLTSRPSRNPIIFGRQELTREWWQNKSSSFDLVVSELVFQEAWSRDSEAARKRISLISQIPSLNISEDAIILAEKLINKGPMPQEFGEDALHIAICV
nr:type II toxin-antitoxin system VapC family toxin [Desulfobulbaceae bacterium]